MEDLFTGQLSTWASLYDWSQTPLGAVENWSSDLKAAMQILVSDLDRAKTSGGSRNPSLYKSQQRYETLLKFMDRGFSIAEMIFDPEGRPVNYRFLEANSLFEQMTGLTEAMGKTALELIPNLENFWVDTFGNMVLTGESIQFEHEAKSLNRWYEVNAFPIDAPPEFRFGVIFTDITARRNAEISLKLIQERLEISLAAGEVGAWDLDLVTKNAWHSIEHDRIFGYEELLPEWNYDQFLSHVIEEDRARVDLAFQQAIANGIPWEIECEIRTPQGEARWIWIKGRTEYDENGQPLRMYGVKRDISDRNRVEQNNKFLVEVQKDLNSIKDINQMLSVVGEKIRAWFGFSILTFGDVDTATNIATTFHSSAEDGKFVQVTDYSLIDFFSEDHLQKHRRGEIVAIDDVFNDPGIKDRGAAYERLPIRSMLTISYLSDGEWKFIISGNRPETCIWRKDELDLMSELIPRIYIEIERSRSEAALASANQRFEAATQAVDGIIFEWSVDTNFIFRSKGLFNLIGVEVEDAPPTSDWWFNLIHPEDQPNVESFFTQIENGQDRYQSEYRVRHADGRWIDMWERGDLKRNGAGEIVEVIGFTSDISDRKFAETAMRQSEERYRNLVELIPQIVWTADHRGTPLDVNQRWLDFTGLTTLKEAQSQGLRPFLHPDDMEVMRDLWEMAQQEGIPLEAESRIRRNDGIYRWYLHQAIPIKNDRGQVIKWFGTCTDIETQKQLEQQHATLLQKVQERNQELDQFCHIVSHDLKAPLRAIANLAQWLEDDIADLIPAENQQQLQLMRSRVYRMDSLITGLLNYARIAREDIPLELVCVEALLSEILDSLAPPTEFTIELYPPFPTFNTKRILLQQVLANLIGNGIKHHGHPDGKVMVTVETCSDFYEFTITDDGKGIAPEQQTLIFNIFETLEGQNHSESTGIGLAIVKKIVETEGGVIQLKSEVGRGSTFSFTWCKYSDRSEAVKS